MHLIAKQNCVIGGIKFVKGEMHEVVNMAQAVYWQDLHRAIRRGWLSEIQEGGVEMWFCREVYREIEIYLDEKGVDYGLGDPRMGPDGKYGIILLGGDFAHNRAVLIIGDVSDRFYDEVVAPGLQTIFRRHGVSARPWAHAPEETDCKVHWEITIDLEKWEIQNVHSAIKR